jgi:apolipoprotein N-acyltransferase
MANVALVLVLGALRPDVVAQAAAASAAAPAAGTDPGAATPDQNQATADPATSAVRAPAAPASARPPRAPRVAAGVAAFAVGAFAVAAGAGPLAFALTPPFPVAKTDTIALVQPGVIDDPAARTDASETLTAQFSTGGRLGGVRPDLIVWGESSIPDDLTGATQADQALLKRIEALSAKDGAEILVNQDTTPPGKGHEKWAVLVSPAGIQGTYVKTRLVPFGEYIPFRDQLGWLTSISKASPSNMEPGGGAHLLQATDSAGARLPIGVLICFESAFPDMSRVDADLGAQLIVYQSSTSTFEGTWGPDQHASLGAIRAAETGRPVVQASLTGDTVAYDARGRQLAWLDQDGHGVVTVSASLPPAGARTFYDQAGDYVMWSGVAITLLAALVMLVRRRHFLSITTGAPAARTAEYDPDTGDPVRS